MDAQVWLSPDHLNAQRRRSRGDAVRVTLAKYHVPLLEASRCAGRTRFGQHPCALLPCTLRALQAAPPLRVKAVMKCKIVSAA